jgi:phosphatidylglycerol:prolipoprotein diacylglycerol transferase
VLPNLHIEPLQIDLFGLKLPIEPFGVLVAVGLLVGYLLGRRRARIIGLDPDVCADAMWWALVSGFVGAHLVSMIFYYPEELAENPLLLLYIWSGISSFGGFVGGVLGGVIFLRRWGASARAYADAIVYGFVPGWIFGRLGCTIVFDHPGVRSDFLLAMEDRAGIARHNLGLYEMLFAVGLGLLLLILRKRRPFAGFYSALILLLYSPVRFMFDFLRTADKTYLGLTPGQYLAIACFLFGAGLFVYGRRHPDPATVVPANEPRPVAGDPVASPGGDAAASVKSGGDT